MGAGEGAGNLEELDLISSLARVISLPGPQILQGLLVAHEHFLNGCNVLGIYSFLISRVEQREVQKN